MSIPVTSSVKMQCFKCTQTFCDIPAYFTHIKDTHEICGKDRFTCTLCNEIFKEFGRFKKHIKRCFDNNSVLSETEQDRHTAFLEAYNAIEIEHHDITAFRSKMKNSALHLVTKMNAHMDTSRSLVYETIAGFQEYISPIIDGTILSKSSSSHFIICYISLNQIFHKLM